jgi:Xaa-Pro aminopeptidase
VAAGGETIVLIGDSESNADLYYTTSFQVTVPVIYVEHRGKKTLLVNDLEYGRARSEACVDEIVSTTPFEDQLRARKEPVRLTSVLHLYLRERRLRRLVVPASFPLAHADRLRKSGYRIRFRDDPFFPQRAVKLPAEIRAIEATQECAEEAMGLAHRILARSAIRSGRLHYQGKPLTSEALRLELHRFLLGKNCQAWNTIVAGGDQAADPHARGSGPLPAHQPIIIDIFPRSMATRFWGDMTRTFVRGKVSPAVRKLHQDVLAAQDLVFALLKEGADGLKVHEQVVAFFKARGNSNGERKGKKIGFIHGTGHGIGLEIHEPPRLGRVESKLEAGQVVTVEPGLYYPGVGSVRLEDVVVITRNGCRNLNRFPKEMET